MFSFWLLNILIVGTVAFIVSRCPVSTFELEEQASGDEVIDFPTYVECPENQTFDGKLGCVPKICPGYRVYFNQTGKCYPTYHWQGPCGKLMHLASSKENHQIGKCECSNSNIPDQLWTRPLVHCPQTQQCYYIFDQGPCEKGQWITAEQGEPKCEQIPCPDKYKAQLLSESDPQNGMGGPKFIFAFGGKCYSTLSQAFCPEGKLAVFTKDNFKAKCLTEAENWNGGSSSGSGPDNSCPGGKTPDVNGGCEPNANV